MASVMPSEPLYPYLPADRPPIPRAGLPTMFDLPSEEPGDPGVPDEFHIFQPQLLRETFRPPNYPRERVFVATDLNLYYDLDHLNWYKRPDWFAALGVSRLYEDYELRLSYVIWQEQVRPYLIVELLSPGSEPDDLGKTLQKTGEPPTKWKVYEEILGVPYYVVFNRYTDELYYFRLLDGGYREIHPEGQRLWLPEAQLGIGLWRGEVEDRNRRWLRFYGADGNWIQTPMEQERQRAEQERQRAEQERQRAEQERQNAMQERQRAERLAARLKALGIEPDDL